MFKKVLFVILIMSLLVGCTFDVSEQENKPNNNDLQESEVDSNKDKESESESESESDEIENEEHVAYEIIDNYNRTTENSIGSTYLQGVVVIKNTGNTNLYLNSCQFDIEDENGALIASQNYISGYPQVLAPEECGVYFEDIKIDNLDLSKTYTIIPHLDVKKAKVDLIRLDYSDISISNGDYNLFLKILGRVYNQTEEDFSLTQIVAICYDAEDKIIALPFTYEDFKTGEKKGFEISHYAMFDIKAEDIARYEIYVYPHQYQFN